MYVLGGSFLLLIFLFISMRYIISGSKLLWTTGSIDIRDIRLVKRTYNPLSAPAASLKRLSIYKKGRKYPYIFISPVKEQQFIEELKAINPDINIIVPPDKKGIWRIWDWDI